MEEHDETVIEAAHGALVARDLPAVRGEAIDGDVAGYHYIPARDQVIGWIAGADLAVVDEEWHPEDGWAYRHFLLRRVDAGPRSRDP